MNTWVLLKRAVKRTPLLADAAYTVKHVLNYYFLQKFGELNSGEIAVFDAIKRDIRIAFDIGARFNTEYADMCAGLDVEMHLFEPNPMFFRKLRRRLANNRLVHLHNIALSDKPGELTYYKDTQSFVKSHHMMESRLPAQTLPVTTLSHFCDKAGIKSIDFLKVDVEALDYHVLHGGRKIIQDTCRYCQVEIGIGAYLESEKITASHYVDFFGSKFDLYLIRDEKHPLFTKMPYLPVLTPYISKVRTLAEDYLKVGYGPNLFAIRRGIKLPDGLRRLCQR